MNPILKTTLYNTVIIILSITIMLISAFVLGALVMCARASYADAEIVTGMVLAIAYIIFGTGSIIAMFKKSIIVIDENLMANSHTEDAVKEQTNENIGDLNKYCVTVARTGVIYVAAEDESEAMCIADHQETETVSWTDSWEVTDVVEDNTLPLEACVFENAF